MCVKVGFNSDETEAAGEALSGTGSGCGGCPWFQTGVSLNHVDTQMPAGGDTLGEGAQVPQFHRRAGCKPSPLRVGCVCREIQYVDWHVEVELPKQPIVGGQWS